MLLYSVRRPQAHGLRLLRRLWCWLKKGDIVLGERAFGEYTTLAALPQRGVDVVARLHQKRKVDFRRARRLGIKDALFIWTKGWNQSTILSPTLWRGFSSGNTRGILLFPTRLRGVR